MSINPKPVQKVKFVVQKVKFVVQKLKLVVQTSVIEND